MTVRTELHGARLEIVLDRPEQRNALNPAMVEALAGAIERARADDVRVVVLRGEGRAFCVGGDVKYFRDALVGQTEGMRTPDRLHDCIEGLATLPRIVVAAVHGACAGAGLGLTLAADLVVASEGARFSTAYLGIGASPDAGTTYFLPRVVGWRKAVELFINPTLVGAAEAERIGLVNQVVPDGTLLERARAYADLAAAGPIAAQARLKALVHSSFQSTLRGQLGKESAAIQASFDTEDFAEGVSAFVEKRFPQFQGR